MLLVKPDQIEVNGNRIVAHEDVQKLFSRDRGLSLLKIPLDKRRMEIEELPWVEEASVQRILPNRVRVFITERTPIAFFRNGTELTLVDAHGVLLDHPEGEDFHFPIVTGLSESLPREERERRMQTYEEFMKDVDLVKPGSPDQISELDLSNPRDLRVVMAGLGGNTDWHTVAVHLVDLSVSPHVNSNLVEALHGRPVGRWHCIDLEYCLHSRWWWTPTLAHDTEGRATSSGLGKERQGNCSSAGHRQHQNLRVACRDGRRAGALSRSRRGGIQRTA